MSPFVDPVTKDKIRFNPDCRTLVPPSQLDKLAFGGDYNFEYKHDEYFPAIHKMAKQRREENLARWRQFGGGKCGLSEFIIKGGMENERTSEDIEREAADNAESVGVSGVKGSGLNASSQPSQKDNDVNSLETPALTPAVSQSVATSGQSSPVVPETPANKASETNGAQVEGGQKSGVNGGRERVNSSDSFVTSPEISSPALEASSHQVQDGKLQAVGNGSTGTLETGVAGLVIKDDGSIGAA